MKTTRKLRYSAKSQRAPDLYGNSWQHWCQLTWWNGNSVEFCGKYSWFSRWACMGQLFHSIHTRPQYTLRQNADKTLCQEIRWSCRELFPIRTKTEPHHIVISIVLIFWRMFVKLCDYYVPISMQPLLHVINVLLLSLFFVQPWARWKTPVSNSLGLVWISCQASRFHRSHLADEQVVKIIHTLFDCWLNSVQV